MSRSLETPFTSFKLLEWQQEPASRDANSSRNTIKIYRADEPWLAGILGSSLSGPSSVPKVFRPRLLVAELDLLTPHETPYVAKPLPIDMPGGLGRLFSKLPGEIRNVIYSDLLSSGHPQFLRASKAIHFEGSTLVQEQGIYHLKIGFSKSINHVLPSQRVADTIRHLDIRAKVSDALGPHSMIQDYPDIWLLQAFGGSRIRRGVCNVSFEFYPAINNTCMKRVCASLKLLSGFEKVVVRAKIDRRASAPPTRKEALRALHRIADTPVHWSDGEFRRVHRSICDELERNLGEPYPFGRDEHSLCYVFHPRKALDKAPEGFGIYGSYVGP